MASEHIIADFIKACNRIVQWVGQISEVIALVILTLQKSTAYAQTCSCQTSLARRLRDRQYRQKSSKCVVRLYGGYPAR